ncbi:Mechanosensitive ion channel family protein [uncultured Sphingopyxis sp.]|uniref:Small-conductance mechanosensitive channel n=1 Tax=uncultured Sphingopyxis sp. TaxID=310581 RepID=A0A1Y5Q2Z0_9SPHN|nr:Mechanosensitive ion channel family protein [uncultured Sphingopyxis sp.]
MTVDIAPAVTPQLVNTAIVWGLQILYAGVILAAGLWLAFFISNAARRQAAKHPRIDETLGSFLALVIRYVIIAFVVIAVLQKFGVQTASLVAALGAGALAIGLALQGTLGNVASGIMIAFMRPYRIGDFVEVNGLEGQVVDLDLFFTQLETLDDKRIYVPNTQAVSNPIVNFSREGIRRCILLFGIGYDDDIDKAAKAVRDVLMADPRTRTEPPIWIGVDNLGEYSVDISVRAWTSIDDYFQYRADMLQWVKEAFDREGIDIPYPHGVEISKGEIELRMPPIKPPSQPQNI